MLAFFENQHADESEYLAWQFLLAACEATKEPTHKACYLTFSEHEHKVVAQQLKDATTCLWCDEHGVWCRSSQLPALALDMFDLYLPLLEWRANTQRVVAHLGQSLDSQIATANGDAFFVTGEENRKHLHCLRALSDAVIVGAGTVVADNPQLTTRAVAGNHPVRVVLDPRAELDISLGLFTDGQAPTVLLHQSSANLNSLAMSFGPVLKSQIASVKLNSGELKENTLQVQRWVVPDSASGISPQQVVSLLVSQGLRRLFVEGGGVTISRFFESAVLDRMHIAVAPLLVGQGRAALQIEGVQKMMNAHRPPCAIYQMGDDVLWDFDVSGSQQDATQIKQVESAGDAPLRHTRRII